MNKITLSKNFVKALLEKGIDKSEIETTLQKWDRNFIPVQKISNAMEGTTQVLFNIKKGGIEIIDPFNISKLEKFYSIKKLKNLLS